MLKEILFLFLYWLLLIIFIKVSINRKFNNLYIIITSLFFIILLKGMLEIRDRTKDNFTFEVTPAKKCAGGPYMYSSDKKLQEECSKITNEEMAQVACGQGFHGRPDHFDFTPLSNSKWENERCSSGYNENEPCVL